MSDSRDELMGNDERRDGTVEYVGLPDDDLYFLLVQTRQDVAAVLRKADNFNRQTIIAFLEVESARSRGKGFSETDFNVAKEE